MAEMWNHHNGEPVNEGERIVVERLLQELPDDFLIIPDLQIRYGYGRVDEIDALVITPFCVVVVEIKDYKHQVVFGAQQHWVNQEERKDPVGVNAGRARRIKGKLADADSRLGSLWVSDQVVLAREPHFLDIHEMVKSKVTTLERASRRLSDPESMVPNANRIQPFETEWVLKALDFKLKRRAKRESFGPYKATELLESDSAGSRLYEAEHTLTQQKVQLRVHTVDPFLSEEERDRSLAMALRSYQVLVTLQEKEADMGEMILPTEAFPTDTGQIVTVTPLSAGRLMADGLW